MIEIFHCDQGSEDWINLRLGIPTMSEAHTILAKGKDGGISLTRAKYLRTLAAERLSGEPAESYTNGFMERGKRLEAEARAIYAYGLPDQPELVGFVRNEIAGASPDALIGADGMAEIKTRMGHLQVELLIADKFPPEHRAQVQGNLWVTERHWCDLVVYSPGLPLYVSRQHRDELYIKTLASEVERFNDELAGIVEKIKRYGAAT